MDHHRQTGQGEQIVPQLHPGIGRAFRLFPPFSPEYKIGQRGKDDRGQQGKSAQSALKTQALIAENRVVLDNEMDEYQGKRGHSRRTMKRQETVLGNAALKESEARGEEELTHEYHIGRSTGEDRQVIGLEDLTECIQVSEKVEPREEHGEQGVKNQNQDAQNLALIRITMSSVISSMFDFFEAEVIESTSTCGVQTVRWVVWRITLVSAADTLSSQSCTAGRTRA